MRIIFLLLFIFLVSFQAESKINNESEVGLTINQSRPYAGSAKDSNSTSVKSTLSNSWEANKVQLKGSYLATSTKTDGISALSANQWSLGLRYEREFSEWMSGFLGYTVEGDITKYDQQSNLDIGAKYFLTKKESTTWFLEAGYRNVATDPLAEGDKYSQSAARVYTEASHKVSSTTNAKLTVEYIQNLTKPTVSSVELDRPGSKLIVEPSVSVKMSDTFSLKSSYIFVDEELANNQTTKQGSTTRTVMTSLLAKF